jgi:alpha-mannosidase
MDLGRQWNERLKIWIDYLPRLFYREKGTVPAVFFTTMEPLSPGQAAVHQAEPVSEGYGWGKKWQYGWFRFSLTVPRELCGKRIVCYPDTGGESLVFVDGKAAGALDKRHAYITLTRSSIGGQVFDLLAESYAGHGIRPENGGPYGPDEIPVPEPEEPLARFNRISWGIWNEEVYQTAMDAFVLYSLLSVLPETSLRAQKVAVALKQFTLEADYELPEPACTESIVSAGRKLKPLLACVNGSTSPVMSIFGQSHLDLAWLWPFEETKRKCARTYANQLALMEEYPGYRFLACEPYILETIRNLYPELYERIEQKIRSGQIFCDGAFWIECDTNIPCGEALIRQLVRGTRWFRENCGKDVYTAWLPDSFGFSASLPQILAGCGIRCFTSQKLARIDPECEPFPYNNFYWEGLDGTRILCHFFKKNNAEINPASLWERWNRDRIQKDAIDGMLFPFGYGDGGGGATRTMLENVRRTADLEGIPRTKMETLEDFFSRLENPGDGSSGVTNVYTGELYLSWHRGTYTSQARTKRLSRKAETALHEADFWTALASFTGKYSITESSGQETDAQLEKAWSGLLFCQFHDILSGTSIKRVHDEAEAVLKQSSETALHLTTGAVSALAGAAESLSGRYRIVTNSLGWDRNELITDPENGKLMAVRVPAAGWTILSGQYAAGDASHEAVACRVMNEKGTSSVLLENRYIRIIIDGSGRLISVYDRELDMELAAGPCNSFSMYKDVTPFYDAWELSPMYRDMPVKLSLDAEISIADTSPEYIRVKIIRQLHDSRLEQTLLMRSESRRIDFETTIDWHEKHKLLKVDFPLAVHAEEAVSETQFGFVRRPAHTSRTYDRDRYEVCNHRYTVLADAVHGAAVLNDCKYGVSVRNGTISLSLLRAPVIPDMAADQGIQQMTYSLYVFRGCFEQSNTVREAYNLNIPLRIFRCDFPQAPSGKDMSFFTVENPAVILETVKRADSGRGIVLRMYETYGAPAESVVKSVLPAAYFYETDMAEKRRTDNCLIKGGSFTLKFRAFEIKTVILEEHEK